MLLDVRVVGVVALDHYFSIFSLFERLLAGQKDEGKSGRRPDVDLLIMSRGFTTQLRRQVRGGAQLVVERDIVRQKSCEAKVSQFYLDFGCVVSSIELSRKKHVLQLDVPVRDRMLVQKAQSGQDLARDALRNVFCSLTW